MKLIDLHCDTIDLITDNNKNLLENDLCIDLKKLEKAKSLVQTFALFVDKENTRNLQVNRNAIFSSYDRAIKMYEKFNKELKLNREKISLVKNYTDILNNEKQNKISALLSIEEGAVFEGKLENIKKFYDLGVRMSTLTWNYENELSFPNGYDLGLKKFGFEVIEYMNELGIIIDVSHISDKGFYDIFESSKKPFIASHSNSRYITSHKRNLTDDMIKKLSESGGVTGINFCKFFLNDNFYLEYSTLDEITNHIKHIKNIGGIDCISIGTDFDGIENKVEIKDISEMNKLYDKLKKEKFSESEIEKIFYKNALRVMKDIL